MTHPFRAGIPTIALILAACGPAKPVAGVTSDGPGTGTVATSSSSSASEGSEGMTSSASGPASSSSDPSATGVSSSSSGGPGCNFICIDYGDDGPPFYCDVVEQDCPEGQKCTWPMPYAYDDPICVPIEGDGVHGDPCAFEEFGHDDCGKGHVCMVDDEPGEGTCLAFCTGTKEDPECMPGYTCVLGRGYFFCQLACDPIGQNCGEGETCINDPEGDGWICVLDASGGMKPAGSSCEFLNSCNPGNLCIDVDAFPHAECEGALGCCSPFCDLNEGGADNPVCAALADEVPGLECVSFYEEGQAPPEYAHVGLCVAP